VLRVIRQLRWSCFKNCLRHDAEVRQPIAFIGVQLGSFGNQTPANDRAELAEDTRFHGVLLARR
jgi:hypothetical protein